MPLSADPDLLDRLRSDLGASDFTVDGVEHLLGPVASAALHREQVLPARRAAASVAGRRAVVGAEVAASSKEPLATLVRAFLLGEHVARRRLDAALPGLGTGGAARLGLIEAAGHGADDPVRPLVDLRPYAASDAGGEVQWWLASDPGESVTGGTLRPDHVLGAGGASLTLAQLTVRAPVGRVLDLGTGCGIQALHAARHAGHVVGTDISSRALAFARFNAALAGADIELREGSMLEPVQGERFDLVVSNPPFVITPRATGALPDYEYRDGGRSGDDLVRDLVRDVGTVLAPGGVVQMLGNWEHHAGEGWRDRLGAWLDIAATSGRPLDAWVVQREVLDPAEYAETWLRDGGLAPERDREAWDRAYRAWLDDFEARGVDAVGMGFLTLRRPATGRADGALPWRRLEERTDPLHMPLGATIAATLAAHDWLAAHDDDALRDARLAVAPDVSDERSYRPGAADPSVVVLRQGGGFGRGVHASSELAALVGACDGELSVGQIVAALGTLTGQGEGALAEQLLPAVRGLVLDGFLTTPR